jgi:hypothetical protein
VCEPLYTPAILRSGRFGCELVACPRIVLTDLGSTKVQTSRNGSGPLPWLGPPMVLSINWNSPDACPDSSTRTRHRLGPASWERNLALTKTGLGNLLAAPFGGYLMCHGAGGIAGHVRFGARTATAPVLIGFVFVVLGIGFGESGYALLKTIPDAVLGGLLLFSGLELALSSKPQEYRDGDLFLVLLMAAVGVALNPAAAFAVGLPLAYTFKQKWLRIELFR